MRPPGLLADLGRAGARAWSRRVAARLEVLLQGAGPNPFLRAAPDAETAGLASADWPGFPSRVAACLGRAQALALLDWSGPSGPRALQEEYVEWRVVRDADAISRVELTTEFGEYWRVLAAHEPERTLALVARFAERDDVEPESVYGPLDPFAPGVTADEREAAFADAMLDPRAMSPYNDGRAAICCMVQPSNTLDALLGLAIAATTRRIARDDVSGRLRCMTCDEAIPLMDGSAMARERSRAGRALRAAGVRGPARRGRRSDRRVHRGRRAHPPAYARRGRGARGVVHVQPRRGGGRDGRDASPAPRARTAARDGHRGERPRRRRDRSRSATAGTEP